MKLLVSACLLGVNCKHSGGNNYCPGLAALAANHTLIPVCPEQLGGLPTPRIPAERKGEKVLTAQGKDVTASYEKGAQEVLALARTLDVDGAILKARSPSCGCGVIYDGSFTHKPVQGDGVTAALLKKEGYRVWTELDLEE